METARLLCGKKSFVVRCSRPDGDEAGPIECVEAGFYSTVRKGDPMEVVFDSDNERHDVVSVSASFVNTEGNFTVHWSASTR